MMTKVLPICFASDNGYAEHLLVAIFSLLVNLHPDYKTDIYILDWGIKAENKQHLKNLEKKFKNVKIHLIEVKDKIYTTLPAMHLSKEAYFRIWIADILPELDKILYFDCDIIVDKDISQIFKYDITNYAIWCPNDIGTFYAYRDILHIPYQYEYFNSGVLLMNLNYFRKHHTGKQIFEYILSHKLITWDQDALNAILYDKRLAIPLKYNALDWVFRWPRNKLFTKKEYQEAKDCPVAIHYAWAKPRKKYCFHPKKWAYHTYRKLAGLEPITFPKKADYLSLIKNLIWLFGTYCLNSIPREWYYYLVFKPKYILTTLLHK